MLDVAVILVTHDSAEVLPGFLESLAPACSGLRWQLVVADNASGDDSLGLVRDAFPDATIVETGGNPGYAAAIDAAVDAAPASAALLVTNPDIRAPEGAVGQLLGALRPGIGVVGPRIVGDDGSLALTIHRAPTVSRALSDAVLGGERARRWVGETVNDPGAYESAAEVDWLSGAFLAISRRCHDELGGWDPRFFLYSEETDFALRARDAGWRVRYEPSSTVVHVGGESTTSPWLYTILTVNRLRLASLRMGPLRRSAYTLVVALGELLRSFRSREPAVHRAALRSVLSPRRRPAQVRPRLDPRADGGVGATSDERSGGDAGTSGWVCFSAQDWWYHNRAHSDFQLMRRVARERPVLFVNSIGMRMPAPGRTTQVTRRILRKARSVLRFMSRPLPDTPGFHVITPVIVPLYGSEPLRRLNAWLVRWQVRLAARKIGIQLGDAVIMVTIPTAWDVVEPLPRAALALNRSDLHSAFEETDQALIRDLERSLLTHSDVVLYTSRSLMELEAPLSADRAVFLDHGVDLERFGGDVGRPPAGLADIDGPVMGFFGGLDAYVVDLALLATVAREVPEATLLLIGDATGPIDELLALPNVVWLGFRPYEEIPAHGATFDVALMPWLRNEWIEHANPIKLKEYLALGLPVVSTDFPEVRFYDDVVAIADDEADFVRLVREALDGRAVGTVESRRSRVSGSSWDRRAHELLELAERAGH